MVDTINMESRLDYFDIYDIFMDYMSLFNCTENFWSNSLLVLCLNSYVHVGKGACLRPGLMAARVGERWIKLYGRDIRVSARVLLKPLKVRNILKAPSHAIKLIWDHDLPQEH